MIEYINMFMFFNNNNILYDISIFMACTNEKAINYWFNTSDVKEL